MTIRRWRRGVIALAAMCLLSVGIVGSASANNSPPRRVHLTATAVAAPVLPNTSANEQSLRDQDTASATVKLDAVATSSITCDGCTATSVTAQLVYVRHARALTADNVATAWSASCSGCRGWALSLQVVIARAGKTVTAANRSLAANVTCVGCSTSAIAVQIIVVAPNARRLSWAARAQLDALRDELIAQLRATPPTAGAARSRALAVPNGTSTPAPSDPVSQAVVRAQTTISQDLGATSARHDVQVSVRH